MNPKLQLVSFWLRMSIIFVSSVIYMYTCNIQSASMYITGPSVELVNVYGSHSSSDLLIIAWVTPISDCYGLIN